MMVVAAPDKFRATASAAELAAAVGTAATAAGWDCVAHPLADGGEGTLEVLGGPNRLTRVSDPLGRPVDAPWRLDADGAVLEAAAANGLVLVGGAEHNDPVAASTGGVGELLVAAVRAGAEQVILGVGGSATTDGGAGAAAAWRAAMGDRPLSMLHVCCDVSTRFTEAAIVYGPQKGATPVQVEELTGRLRRLREDIRDRDGIDLDQIVGSGAAGGLAGGLAALGARLVPGLDAIADRVGLDKALTEADLVVTGEGRFDATSLQGKVAGGVIDRARALGVPVLVVAGSVAPGVHPGDGVEVVDLVRRFGSARSFRDAAGCVRQVVEEVLRR